MFLLNNVHNNKIVQTSTMFYSNNNNQNKGDSLRKFILQTLRFKNILTNIMKIYLIFAVNYLLKYKEISFWYFYFLIFCIF